MPRFVEEPRGFREPGYGSLKPVAVPLASFAATAEAARAYGPDFYHGNTNLVPAAALKAAGMAFVIIKVSQGTSYPWADSWFPQNARAIRDAGLPLGGYHMLSGTSGSGAEQAAYFLSKYTPQPGDVVPCMDFEASGRGSASIQEYRDRAVAFVAAIHAAGFPCLIYGHADVKAAWADWRSSGADFWWVPGDSAHNDVGPVGPDLWQYGPYTSPAGFPTNGGSDMSVVMTNLPLVGGGEDDVRFDDFAAGMDYREAHPADKMPAGKSADFQRGWHTAKMGDVKPGPPGKDGADGADGARGPRGPAGADGKSVTLKAGDVLEVKVKAP